MTAHQWCALGVALCVTAAILGADTATKPHRDRTTRVLAALIAAAALVDLWLLLRRMTGR